MPVDPTREHLWGQLLIERNVLPRDELARLIGERDAVLRRGQDCTLAQVLVQQRRLDPQAFLQLRMELEARGRACAPCRRAFLVARPDEALACPGCGGPAALQGGSGSGKFMQPAVAPAAYASGYPQMGTGVFPQAQAYYGGSASGRFQAPVVGDGGLRPQGYPPGGYPAVSPAASGRFMQAGPPPSGRAPAVGLDASLPSLRWNAPRSTPSEEGAPEGSGSGSEVGVGKRFGRFEILEEVGRGGMGVVYKVRDPGLLGPAGPGVMALKVLLAGEFASPKLMERFREEARLSSRLRHPNIVAVHDVGEVDGIPYYAMDYILGSELQDLIRQKNLSIRRGVEILVDVAKAAHYAHQNGVIHRDLKPSNVLVSEDGRPFIMDFGLAKNLEDDKGLTRSGVAIGTPYYMPPEQARGSHREMDARSDVYALGAILYEILTRRVPFTAKTQNELLRKIVEEEPEPPRMVRAGVPAPLELVCLKALGKEKTDRYDSAEAFAEDLERYLANQPVVARPPAALLRLARKIRKNPTTALAVGAVFGVSLLAGGVVWWIAQSKADESALREKEIKDIKDKTDLESRQRELQKAESDRLRDQADQAVGQALDAYANARAAENPSSAREALSRADELLTRAIESEKKLLGQAKAQTAYRRGLVRRGLCKWRDAHQDFLFAAREAAYRARANLARGLLVLRWACDREAARSALQDASAQSGLSDADAREERAAEDVARAYTVYLKGDPGGALNRFQEAVDRAQLYALAAEANGGIAYLARMEGDALGQDELSERGLRPADKAIETERFRYEFLVDRAILRARAGRREDANRDLRAARALDVEGEEPDLADAVVKARLGDMPGMQTALDEARAKARLRKDAPGALSAVELFEGKLKDTLRKNPPPPITEAPPPRRDPRDVPPQDREAQNRVTRDYLGTLEFSASRREIKMQVEVPDDTEALRLVLRDLQHETAIIAKRGAPPRSVQDSDVTMRGRQLDIVLTLRRDREPMLRSGTWHVVVFCPGGERQVAHFEAKYYKKGDALPYSWTGIDELPGLPPILPKDEAGAQRLAQAIQRPAERERALAQWEEMEADAPLMGLVRAQWLNEFGKSDEALQALAKVRSRVPDDPRILFMEGAILSGLDRHLEAEKSLRQLIDRAPDLLDMHYMLASMLQKQDKHDEAVAVCRSVLERDPDRLLAQAILGESLLKSGKREEGVQALRKAIRPFYMVPTVAAAKSLEEEQQYAALLESLDELERQSPERMIPLQLQFMRANALAATGRRQDGIRLLQELRSKISDSELRIELQRELEKLEKQPDAPPPEAPKPPVERKKKS